MFSKIIISLARNGGWITHLIWICGLALAAPSIALASGLPVFAAGSAIACAALPGIIGLIIARRSTEEFSRFALALVWTALGASVAAASGGVTGAGAIAFLLPVAAAASYGQRRPVIEAAALSGITALMVGGLQFGGFLPPMPGALTVFQSGYPVATLFIAMGFSVSAIRALAAHDLYKARSDEFEVRSAAFDAAPVALAICQDGHIVGASRGLHQLSPGLPPRLDGLSFADIGFDEPDRQILMSAGPGKDGSRIAGIRSEKGQRTSVDVRFAEIDGGWVAALTPERHEEFRLAGERDAALSETRAKSEFLASISHEIRTPLNAIIGFSDVMKSRLFGPMPARYAEYADLIHESGRHLLELIGDVLDISRIEADRYELSKETFDACDVVDICTKLMRQRATEAGIHLEVDLPDTGLPVDADRKALRQILLNLLSNAVKFTPKGGAVVAMARREGDDLIMAVGDSGVGISEDEIARLGQPYMQAASARESQERGSGLGLSLVRSLAELHGGDMLIESRQGDGTTVTIRMPIMTDMKRAAPTEDSLEVHDRIRRAQAAGETLMSAASNA